MKKKNIIISSFATIALCLSLLMGSTFALFTSESKVNIAVTSGKVSVVANIDEDSVQTKQLYDTEYEDGKDNMYEGIATFGEEGLTLEQFVPGDGIKFNIVVKNESTVTVKYRTIISCVNDNGLFAGLKVDIANLASYNGSEYVGKWQSIPVGSEDVVVPVTIELPEDAGNDYQEKTCTIVYKVEAIQGNAETFNEIKASSAEEFIAALVNASAGDKIDATGVTIDITEVMPNGTAAAMEIPAGITIKGATFVPTHRGGNYILLSAGANDEIVFENCNFDNAGKNLVIGSEATGPNSVIYNNCHFTGSVITNFVDRPDGVAEFNECTFKKATSGLISRSFVEGMGGTHNFNGCTFDYTDVTQSSMGVISSGCINVYSESEYSTTVVLDNCTRINCGTRTYGPNSSLIIK